MWPRCPRHTGRQPGLDQPFFDSRGSTGVIVRVKRLKSCKSPLLCQLLVLLAQLQAVAAHCQHQNTLSLRSSCESEVSETRSMGTCTSAAASTGSGAPACRALRRRQRWVERRITSQILGRTSTAHNGIGRAFFLCLERLSRHYLSPVADYGEKRESERSENVATVQGGETARSEHLHRAPRAQGRVDQLREGTLCTGRATEGSHAWDHALRWC